MSDNEIMSILETKYPNIQSMNVAVLTQRDGEYPEEYITDTWHMVIKGQHEVLKAMERQQKAGKYYLTDDKILSTIHKDCQQITWG